MRGSSFEIQSKTAGFASISGGFQHPKNISKNACAEDVD
jgi:hypothetical protein